MPTITLTYGSSGSWTVPADWNNANNYIDVYGGGAGCSGGTDFSNGNGGPGGGFARRNNVTLTPGDSISYTIGAGGAGAVPSGSNGGTSSISLPGVTVSASGGAAAAGTGGVGSNGHTNYTGGTRSPNRGGGAAGPSGNGFNGGNGNGGYAGASGGTTTSLVGKNGIQYGGGGSPGLNSGITKATGGAGANGIIVIVYTAAAAATAINQTIILE